MKRFLGWSFVLTVGILLGMASSANQVTRADPPDDQVAESDDANANTLDELKAIKAQLKEINSYLRTGVVKTIAIMNQDAKPATSDETSDEPSGDSDDSGKTDAVAELKKIKTQVKEVNSYLRTGVVKTIAVMNQNVEQ
jgi:hypothetical protein